MRWTTLLIGLLTLSPLALANSALTNPALANPTRPILKLGAQGNEVMEVQALLKLLGYYNDAIDGRYSESTLIAITQFQEAAGLSQDGILGTQTWAKLLPAADATPTTTPAKSAKSPEPKPVTPAKSAATPATPELSQYPILRKGAKGDAVVRVQTRLRSLGFLQAPADGDFGAITEQALKAAQQKYNLDPDGVVGEATWRALKL